MSDVSTQVMLHADSCMCVGDVSMYVYVHVGGEERQICWCMCVCVCVCVCVIHAFVFALEVRNFRKIKEHKLGID